MKKVYPEFTSYLTKGDYIKSLGWLPVHMALLPFLGGMIINQGYLDESMTNFAIYAVGALYMVLFLSKYLRREFDPFCDRPMFCISEVCGHYLAMWFINFLLGALLALVMPTGNPNNEAVAQMAGVNFGVVSATAICLAPIVEEVIFRGAIFGLARKRSRKLAYVLSMAMFSVYHIWGYAIDDPITLIYIVQYLPVSFLLCRCYEKTNSLWSSIFFHTLVNSVSMSTIEAML